MFGLIVRFDLRAGAEAAFDALVAETLPKIWSLEPDTLLYLCHTVRGETRGRVFYELYRDRAAFDAHERQPHVQRFLAERAQHLATEPRVEFLDLVDGKGAASRSEQ